MPSPLQFTLLALLFSPLPSKIQAKSQSPLPSPIPELKNFLNKESNSLGHVNKQPFASQKLSKEQSSQAIQFIFKKHVEKLRQKRQKEFKAKSITLDGKTLKYKYRTLGKKPNNGHSLYISMHGGGSAPAKVNDKQWSNQLNLYTPKEGIMLAPRAPTDTWDLWHRPHVDLLFDRLIENFIICEGVNPNKIYILGYSAGGDGTYQLAPRMADRWAGAAMMAGHPGDAQTYNLLNLPYFIQCGGKDSAYKRNQWCKAWGKKLDQLKKADPTGYPHKWIVYPKYGHWMNRKCKQALPWMANYTRNPWPKKLHWYQDNVTHSRFFWLANKNPKAKQMITAEVNNQTITLTPAKASEHLDPPTLTKGKKGAFTPLPSIQLRLSDQLMDLDQKITVQLSSGKILFSGKVERTIQAITESIQQRPDASSAACAIIKISFQ